MIKIVGRLERQGRAFCFLPFFFFFLTQKGVDVGLASIFFFFFFKKERETKNKALQGWGGDS